MAIRIRRIEKNSFANLKTWVEARLVDETATNTFVFDYEESPGVVKGTLIQVFVSVAAEVFDGSGLDDLTSGGTYTGDEDAIFTIEIDATGTPDTFKWKKDSGNWTTGVNCVAAPTALSEGVTIDFNANTGHTLADKWTIKVMTSGA